MIKKIMIFITYLVASFENFNQHWVLKFLNVLYLVNSLFHGREALAATPRLKRVKKILHITNISFDRWSRVTLNSWKHC